MRRSVQQWSSFIDSFKKQTSVSEIAKIRSFFTRFGDKRKSANKKAKFCTNKMQAEQCFY